MTTREERAYPKTEIGESFLVNAEWHGPRCASNRTGMYRDCDCTLIREIVALEREASVRALVRIRGKVLTATALNDRLIGVRLIHKWLDEIEQSERESSLGRDTEGHLVLTLGPGAESPSRNGERADLKGLSPLEAWNEDANR